MARRSSPYRLYARDDVAWIDIRSIPGAGRIRESLELPYGDWPRRRPTREAAEAAAERYRRAVAGRVVGHSPRVLTSATDEELFALWLAAIETPRTKGSCATKAVYARTWHAFFSDEERWKDSRTPLERMVDDTGPEDYALHRLTRVVRKTVRKELSAMFGFLDWAKRRKHLASIPPTTKLPPGEPGVRSGRQRALPVHVEPSEARAIIDALPEWSDSAKKANHAHRAFRVRDPMEFMWEMTWRPSTIARLSVPENWTHGSSVVVIRDEDDKALYGRTVTLTARARAILERCAPRAGLIFGEHHYDPYLKAAALKVLPHHKALDFARYDFRHGRINHMLEVSGNLLGTGFVAGHKQATTTNAYLRAQQRQGDAAISAVDEEGTLGARAQSPSDNPTVLQSGRVDSNHRPLDPQGSANSELNANIEGSSPEDSLNSPKFQSELNSIGARWGHAPSAVVDAQRALLISELVCSAFDMFVLENGGDE